MLTFITHLPRSLVNEESFRRIKKLMSLLNSIEMSLFKDSSMTSKKLESIFLQHGTTGSVLFVDIKSRCLSILRSLQAYPDEIGLPIGANRSSTENFCFQKASLIFCTTSSAYKLHSVDMKPFSVLIIDEAAQVKECESIIALQIPCVTHAILVGDERQLPATVRSKVCEDLGFGRSLFGRLSSLGHSKHLLNVQYRMHPSISQFPNSNFYLNQILDAPCVQSQSYAKRYLQGRMFGPYSFINVAAWNGTNENLSIGVISPYAAQVTEIQHKLEKFTNLERFIVNVKSVDGFQGGNERTLSKSDSVWEALVFDAKQRRCFFTADEDCEIRETIIKVKKELGQLDDLFSGESILFKNSIWKVSFSDNFRRSFQILIPSNVKKPVISLLLKLASGWRPKKVNVDRSCKRSLYVVKQFKVDMHFIVCSIDIMEEDSIYVQVLKVWDVLPMAETPQLLNKLDNISANYTDTFIKHCNEKLFEGNLEVPKSWSVSEDIIRFKDRNSTVATAVGAAVGSQSYVESSKVSESLMLMKFYSLSTGAVNCLLTDVEGTEMDLPFEVTDEERKIIMFSKSSFILGRSGTGKTTILTMKLLQKFQQYRIASRESNADDNNKIEPSSITLHQLFVTVSPKLCYAIKKHVSQLKSFACESLSGKSVSESDDIDEMAEFNDIPDTFDGIPQEKYPLIITFHKFLMMLDGTVGNSYFRRFRDIRGSSRSDGKRSVSLQTFIRKNEVTYDRFQNLYWPHFNAKLTKDFDPSRVFTEIMSHIKGDCPQNDNKRSRKDYVSLSCSRVSTLNAEKRELIYDIFQDYEKMKLDRGEFDLADFVNDVHLRLKNENNLIGDKMDFVYIDEVQDLTMSQISLFKYICKNVDEGFAFSGDTAQTIARGIDFRFEDIRSLFYNEFFMKSRNCEFREEKGVVSDIFSLSQNFRTHNGVLRLAQSVTDLISHFFPQSIDVLPPEMSIIYGECPVVLEPGSDGNLILTIFGQSGGGGGQWMGFGADQVILVRDDSARQEISKYVGHQALVLTILECKGLEFQDVLLYNFFGSSPLSNQWRVVYEFLKEKDLLGATSPKSFPSFSQSKHNILCSELKQLYVAITRTRQKLWIYESNEELSKPMLDYWRSLCLVQVRKIDDSIAKEMQRSSSPEEWKSQGIKIFWEKNYEMAMMCFKKAGEETWEKRSKASQLRAVADSLRGSNPEEACEMLREAAEIFDSIQRADAAAECFCDLREYERAGRIYLEKCGVSELRKAGECFSLAGNHKIAAEVYAKGYFFNDCLSACSEGNHFDLGLQYIENWRQQSLQNRKEMDKIAQEFLEKCALECFRTKDNATLMKFVRAFNTMESKRHFLKSFDCLDELLSLEEESGNFNEAAEIAKRLGYILREVDLLEKAQQYENASSLVLSYALSNSLWVSGSQGWPLKTFPQKDELLSKAMSASCKVSGTFHTSVCAEAEILSHEQTSLSKLVRCYNASKEYKNRTGEILSVRKLLDAHFEVGPADYKWDPELHIEPRLFDERISSNLVSGGTLLYVWNLWKENSLEILDCINSLESVDHRARCTDEGIVQFCLNYFGVRLQHNLDIISYLLLKPNASWVRKSVDQRSKAVTIDVRRFASAARNYWHQELVSVGFRVLEAFRALHEFSVAKKPLSTYCQGLCLTCIYEVTRFFIESNSLDMKTDEQKLHDFLHLSTTKYFELVFPSDFRQSLSENLISLRETEVSCNLLEKIISNNIKIGRRLTYEEMGRVVMIMLGSGKLERDLYLRIAERFNEYSLPWMLLIRNFNSVQVDLGHQLHQALAETYDNANWRGKKDYISPNCFFYLVERLLILVPHSEGFFFTTKSSFVDYLISLPSDADPSALFVLYEKSYSESIFDFVDSVVQQCLFSIHNTEEWIKNSRIDCVYYFPVLMLRLVMILCLSCLNSDLSFNVILKLLGVPQIRSQLPREFCEALLHKRTNDDSSYIVAVIARAFEVIGNPLVTVRSIGTHPGCVCPPDAVFVDLESCSCRNEIVKALFSRNTNERNVTESWEIGVPPDVSDQRVNLEMNWGLIQEISESLELLRNRNDGNLKSLVLNKKVQ
ncbi:tpr and ankyrin repeat-containing protein 1 [Phtheirospermum japonicum]|uniref:Tpr and ankyrin repeat-containing protein 1 n=1 Tax=Phtheirospermum japonicum TaxID=374723 RepID=A0A830CJ38_9LAMI|nr:tpr and ankyrin repeat-containing protein 1 [Phtheirospermum japonicum]